ncbi:MAG: hypothetical protein JEZ07_00015 [Phycisphaerae bacterium]|nr:hypothetical protein [Phycisphaerae bacterium]
MKDKMKKTNLFIKTLILLVMLLLIFADCILIPARFYQDGWDCTSSWRHFFLYIIPFYLLMLIEIVLWGAVFVVRSAWKKKYVQSSLWAVLGIICLIALYILPLGSKSEIDYHTEGFVARVEKDINYDEIRQWVVELNLLQYEKNQSGNYELNISDCPDSIKKLKPRHIWIVSPEDENQKYALFAWGGGIDCWALAVFMQDKSYNEVPNGRIISTNESVKLLHPGIFFSRCLD